ncbi:MAG: C40 family peptidase [Ferruginibacter sp.]
MNNKYMSGQSQHFNKIICVFLFVLFCGCIEKNNDEKNTVQQTINDSLLNTVPVSNDTISKKDADSIVIPEKNIKTEGYDKDKNDSIVNFAEILLGVPYKYASTDPAEGFDCSGFITYVFTHFKIAVPRSSVDFTNVGTQINLPDAKRGDLILFTGTDSTQRVVGHMGIVTENIDTLKFIHSTSGKKYGVTITTLNDYYKGRFVKVIRYI